MIIADREIDRNFRYAGKKGLPGGALQRFPAERSSAGTQFLPSVEGCRRPLVTVSTDQGILRGELQSTVEPVLGTLTQFMGLRKPGTITPKWVAQNEPKYPGNEQSYQERVGFCAV